MLAHKCSGQSCSTINISNLPRKKYYTITYYYSTSAEINASVLWKTIVYFVYVITLNPREDSKDVIIEVACLHLSSIFHDFEIFQILQFVSIVLALREIFNPEATR